MPSLGRVLVLAQSSPQPTNHQIERHREGAAWRQTATEAQHHIKGLHPVSCNRETQRCACVLLIRVPRSLRCFHLLKMSHRLAQASTLVIKVPLNSVF